MDDLTQKHCQVPPDHYDRGIRINLFQTFWHKQRFEAVRKILQNFNFKKILDIGCHGGTFTEVLQRQFPKAEIDAIDISQEAIFYGRKIRPQINFQVASATALPYNDKNFDLITCFDTFEHLPDSKKVLTEIKRVLNDRGFVFFLLPSENFLFKIIWFFWTRLGPGRVWQETHVHNFNGLKLDDMLEASGFTIEKRQKIILGMLFLILARKKR